eukprot:COSAG01_NODE_10861_length_2066_cov_1.726487_2_plen_361_part_00
MMKPRGTSPTLTGQVLELRRSIKHTGTALRSARAAQQDTRALLERLKVLQGELQQAEQTAAHAAAVAAAAAESPPLGTAAGDFSIGGSGLGAATREPAAGVMIPPQPHPQTQVRAPAQAQAQMPQRQQPGFVIPGARWVMPARPILAPAPVRAREHGRGPRGPRRVNAVPAAAAATTAATDGSVGNEGWKWWQQISDPASGRSYYHDLRTRRSQWERPRELQELAGARANVRVVVALPFLFVQRRSQRDPSHHPKRQLLRQRSHAAGYADHSSATAAPRTAAAAFVPFRELSDAEVEELPYMPSSSTPGLPQHGAVTNQSAAVGPARSKRQRSSRWRWREGVGSGAAAVCDAVCTMSRLL